MTELHGLAPWLAGLGKRLFLPTWSMAFSRTVARLSNTPRKTKLII